MADIIKNIHLIYKTYIEPNFPETERWSEDDFCAGFSNNTDIYHMEFSSDDNCCLVWCELPEKVACIVYFVSLEKEKGYGSKFISDWMKLMDSDWRYVLEASNDRQIRFWKKCGFELLDVYYTQIITMGGNDIPANLMSIGSFPEDYPLERNLRKCVYGVDEP